MRITAIYDNGGATLDRYTVLTDQRDRAGNVDALGLSKNPGDYNGFSQWSTARAPFDRLGKLIYFTDLSAEVQAHIAGRIFANETMPTH